MTDQIVIDIDKDSTVTIGWDGGLSLGNCGIGSIYEFNIRQTGSRYVPEKSMTAEQAAWIRTRYISDELRTNPLAKGIKVLTAEELYKILCANIDRVAKLMTLPLIFMSDRLVCAIRGNCMSTKDGESEYKYGKLTLDTAFLMRAIYETGCGNITFSSIVENPTHPGDSAIAAAFWTPPNQQKRILYEQSCQAITMTAPIRARGVLRTKTKELVKELYGNGKP